MRPGTRRLAALAGLWGFAAVARWLYWSLAEPAAVMEGLTHKYLVCAGHFLNGHGFMLQVTAGAEVPYVDRLPGYVLVLAGLRLVLGSSLAGLAVAHAWMGALQAPLLVLLGKRTVGERAGWIAGLAWALFPPAWSSDVQVLETGLTGVSILLSCWALAGLVEQPGWSRAWVLAGCGGASLALRADNMLVPATAVLVAAWLMPRAQWRYLLPGLLLPVLLLVPWGIRNASVADGFFISAGAGNNLLQGYAEFSRHPEAPFGDRAVAASEGHPGLYWPEPGRRDAERRAKALRLIAADPLGWVSGCFRRFPILLSMHAGELWPGGTPLRQHVRVWRQEHPEAARFEGFLRAGAAYLADEPLRAVFTLAWGPLLLLLAAWGAWRLRRGPHLLLLLLWSPAYGLFIHLPLHAEPRYFLPHASVLALLAAAGFVSHRRRRGARPRVLALLPAVEDARCLRRLRGLTESGFEVEMLGFRRDRELPVGDGAIVLGDLPHGRYLTRLLRYLAVWPRIARAAWKADAVMAFGTDLLGVASQSTAEGSVLVGEVADVRQALLGEGRKAGFFRWLERRALKRADLLVATSPELRDHWLIAQQGVRAERVLVVENKPFLVETARPGSPPPREGPLCIGWFGLLRCGRSWALLRELAARSEGRIRVLLRGIARDLPGLEAEARAAEGVEWGGPYRSPEDLAELYGSVDATWIAHAHGRANSAWARANRFYEGGWFGTPLIAQAGTPDGEEVARDGLGLLIDLAEPEAALRELLKIDREQLTSSRERLLAQDGARFAETEQNAGFSARFRALLAD